MNYRITHRTTYVYSSQVAVSHHAARLRPRDTETQRCLEFSLSFDPEPDLLTEHADSFGNQDAPKIRDMQATSDDPYSVTATFKIQNKPVNAFWALFKVPAVEVTATAFLPSTSVISFTLANGLSFITFVNTVPISATRSVNRFALVRRLSWDKTGLFNARVWDGMARRAMKKILSEDKVMVEQLEYDQLPVEFNVRRLIFYFSPFLSNVLCF